MSKYGTAEFMCRQMEAFVYALIFLTDEQKEKISKLNEKEVFAEYPSVRENEVSVGLVF